MEWPKPRKFRADPGSRVRLTDFRKAEKVGYDGLAASILVRRGRNATRRGRPQSRGRQGDGQIIAARTMRRLAPHRPAIQDFTSDRDAARQAEIVAAASNGC